MHVYLPSSWGFYPIPRGPSGNKQVAIQMFEWNWDSIAAECTNFIGPAGYGFVQTSPPQEHIQGSQWWTDYQPVSYQLVSKRGSRAQFANMINKCHAAGVGVIADTLWNHMAGISSGTGTAGSSFTQYNYPGIYQSQDFHYCGTPSNDISNYNDRYEVQNCELANLADLKTESDYVRGRLAAFTNDLLSLGVDGLRLDAAKHIASSDIANIISRLSKRPYVTQEVIFGNGEPITPSEYTGNGVFRYTSAVKDAFQNGNIASLQNLDNRGWVSSNVANVFVVNHDTERNGASLSYKSSNNIYTLATIFKLAHPYGAPTILSSYSFSDQDVGSPNNGAASCSATGGSGGWNCQHRWVAISGMVGFRNTVGSAGITNWVSPASNRIAFGRGSAGFVAINNADSAWTATFSTSLPAGSYCDVIRGKSTGSSCTGASHSVSGGSFTVTIPARDAVALHTGQRGSGGTVSVTFEENATTNSGENIFVTGSISQLGSWNTGSAVALSSTSNSVWKATISFPASTAFEFKFIKKTSSGSVIWESDPNRQVTLNSSGSQTITTSWR
ncbi:glycoside hydrolase [Panaeolus papilionaceus]|nr:glycoside hydrolase [Panaeolus papilionaceus]